MAKSKAKTEKQPVKKGDAWAKVDAIGLDSICASLSDGKTLTAIADEIGVSIGTLLAWLAADAERSARAREARSLSARIWDEKAESEIAGARDPFELSRAKELAHHYRWRAAKTAPKDYGEKIAIGGADDLPAIQSETTFSDAQLAAIAAASSR